MGKAEVGTAKHAANLMKAKGLQKLKFYCQPCEKQMRDENGYKCHVQSEGHLKRVRESEREGKYGAVARFSQQFEKDFVYNLRTLHGEKPIGLNKFYNEFIQDRDHIHMNATRWPSLIAFAAHLNRKGVITLEEEAHGHLIAYRNAESAAEIKRQELQKQKQLQLQELGRQQLDKEQLEQMKAHEARMDPVKSAASQTQNTPPETEGVSLKISVSQEPAAAAPPKRKRIALG